MNIRWAAVVVAAVVLAAGVGAVAANLGTSDETINACYNEKNGRLRLLVDGQTCKRREVPISWNQVGPQGPAGPPGPAGSGGDYAAAIRFGTSTEGCAPDSYRVIVAQASGPVPEIVSGPCEPIFASSFHSTWEGSAAIPISSDLGRLAWHVSDGGYTEIDDERWSLDCSLVPWWTDQRYIGDTVVAEGDLVTIRCQLGVPQQGFAPYPTTGPLPAEQELIDALSSGELLSAPILFFEAEDLPDRPALSTTTSTTTTPTTTTISPYPTIPPPYPTVPPAEPPTTEDACAESGTGATRQQVAYTLWRDAGQPTPSVLGSELYDDVDPGSDADAAIGWIVEEGIALGTSDSTFGPHRGLARAGYLVYVWRYYGSPTSSTPTPYVDVDPGAFYSEAVAWSFDEGLAPLSPTAFGPDATMVHDDAADWWGVLSGGGFDYFDCPGAGEF